MAQQVAKCGIYETRPEACRRFPTSGHWVPPECTYTFPDASERQGDCACDVGACCAVPRKDGDPVGAVLSEEDGGLPCRHLTWVDRPMEKTASSEDAHVSGVEHGRRSLLRVLDDYE